MTDSDFLSLFDNPRDESRITDTAESEAVRLSAMKLEAVTRLSRACGKCHGAGKIGAYVHVAGGVCFACNGSGVK